MTPPILGCLPGQLHPVSEVFLKAWLAGEISTANFRRFFHLPDSDYLDVAQCILTVTGAG